MKQRWEWQRYFFRKVRFLWPVPKHLYISLSIIIYCICLSHFLLSFWLLSHRKKANSRPQCSDTTTYPPETTDEKYAIKIRPKIRPKRIPNPAPNRRHVLNNASNCCISITNKPNCSLRCLLMAFHDVWFVLGRRPPTFLPLHNVQRLIRNLSITHASFQEHHSSWVVTGSFIWFFPTRYFILTCPFLIILSIGSLSFIMLRLFRRIFSLGCEWTRYSIISF